MITHLHRKKSQTDQNQNSRPGNVGLAVKLLYTLMVLEVVVGIISMQVSTTEPAVPLRSMVAGRPGR
jgi:hypothetical protein